MEQGRFNKSRQFINIINRAKKGLTQWSPLQWLWAPCICQGIYICPPCGEKRGANSVCTVPPNLSTLTLGLVKSFKKIILLMSNLKIVCDTTGYPHSKTSGAIWKEISTFHHRARGCLTCKFFYLLMSD